MILSISSNFRIKTDTHNWIVQRTGGTRKHPVTGEPMVNWKDVGYYPTLQDAVLGTYRKRLLNSQASQLVDILAENETILAELCTALSRIIQEHRTAILQEARNA